MEKKYWKGVEELRNDAEFVRLKNNEFAEYLPIEAVGGKSSQDNNGTNRRDFLKLLGFSVAAASLASCEAPVNKSIPYLVKPEEVTPGVANWYASTYTDGQDYCSVLVKTREGRPIKIEGNPASSITGGGTSARVQASVLSLYDSARLRGPVAQKTITSWDTVDKEVGGRLAEIREKGGNIRILSSTVASPSLRSAIAEFASKNPNTKHIVYDAVSHSAMISANQRSFGKPVIPTYRLDNANIIVSFGADFLVNWLSPIEHARQYVRNRKLKDKKMSRHYQFETHLSVTGSNADKRVPLRPSEQALALVYLYNRLAGMAGAAAVQDVVLEPNVKDAVEKAAKDLWSNRGKALVIAGANDVHVQTVTNGINSLLEGYGSIIDLDNPSNLHQGNDTEVENLIKEMSAGSVQALIVLNCNPAYSLPNAAQFTASLNKVGLKVAISDRQDETASACDYICPDHHYLEAWTDAEPRRGSYSLGQPTIQPLFETRSAIETFLKWSGNNTNAHDYIASVWNKNIFGKQSRFSLFQTFWNTTLQEGVFETTPSAAGSYKTADISAAASAISRYKNNKTELSLYEKAGIGNGNQANNPWLQELPDPISKICWDNYVAVSPRFAKEKGLEQGNVVSVSANGVKIEAPVVIQPGQAYNSVSIAVGYGRRNAGKAAEGVGVNAYPFARFSEGTIHYTAPEVNIEKTGKDHELAATQTHHTVMGRDMVKETTLTEYIKDPKAGNPPVLVATQEGKKAPEDVNFWESHDKPNHKWAMAIDLNSCIGCGACVVSCNAENNIPVVGKDEIRRSREMHWIRIDRYYSSITEDKDNLKELEIPEENPDVVFQPMLCQQCNHAPCETVCPVAATTHSSEGLNQMAYNRCVGTRYCANNCPYKVRRFNWFKYSDNPQFDFNMNDDLGKMVLNPDVVVRSRGVMEKCTFCVQRLQAGKLEAKKEGRRPKDGEIVTACAQACPTNAIIFGDLNDKESAVARLFSDERSYQVLDELDVQPSIVYQTKVRNV
jgi:MoCo/4Fe-4S cofactor protein with predicted Tat translocation signal